MAKKKYETPRLKVALMEISDIICTSDVTKSPRLYRDSEYEF